MNFSDVSKTFQVMSEGNDSLKDRFDLNFLSRGHKCFVIFFFILNEVYQKHCRKDTTKEIFLHCFTKR